MTAKTARYTKRRTVIIMGMYDIVECNYPLPKCPKRLDGWQTKSLDCLLDTYRIDADGSIWKRASDFWDDENKGPKEFVKMADFTGSVEIHDMICTSKLTTFIGYVLLFLDGKCIAARLKYKDVRKAKDGKKE